MIDDKLTENGNKILSKPVPGEWVGIDLWLNDREMKPWAISNRFRPAERTEENLAAYRNFVDLSVPYVRTAELDILTSNQEILDEVLGLEPYDVVVFSTVANQLTAPQLTKALKTVKSRMSSEGLIFMQDFVWADKSAPNELRFDKQWSSYNTLLFDMADQEAGWQHVFEAANGRSLELVCSLGSVALEPGLEKVTSAQLLAAA
jgi:hypothetical protein